MTQYTSRSYYSSRARLAAFLAPLVIGCLPTAAKGQAAPNADNALLSPPPTQLAAGDSGNVSTSADPLPPTPEPQTTSPTAPQSGGLSASTPPASPGQHPIAPLHAKFIPAGYSAQPVTAHDKVLIGLGDLYSVENFGAIVLSAAYEHGLNDAPNYGTDRFAFGQRVGAAAIRETSQGIFSDMVFAPLFHQDNRYYQMGPGHNVITRIFYSGTRTLITRTDTGHSTINASLLVGYAAATAITPAYYPSFNRNARDTFETYGTSIGGAAVGFLVDEFSSDLLIALHLKHAQ